MIDHSHTPVWLKCTDRWKIDPMLKNGGSIYGSGRGYDDYNRKLSDKQVRDIRESKSTMKVLAKKYKVAYSTIWHVKSGRGYADVV